jgi:hypothetical protein
MPFIRSAITIARNKSVIRRAARAPKFQIFAVDRMGDLTLLSTTVTGGNAPDAYPRDGSAIYNQGGTVRINNSTITGNSAPNAGGGIAQGYYRNTMIINNEGTFPRSPPVAPAGEYVMTARKIKRRSTN